MPKANWGIKATEVDDYNRDDLYKPYMGPTPANAVYKWRIKKMQYIAATEDAVPQLRVGLELVPRDKTERKYKGYYITAFIHISDRTQFRYIPFLDALGVSGRDFTTRTIYDEQLNIQKIGDWRNDGKTIVAGQLLDNDPEFQHKNPKTIGWLGEAPSSMESEDDDDDFEDEEESSEDDFYDDEEEEEDPKPRKRTGVRRGRSSGSRATQTSRSRRRSRRDDFE